LFLFATPRSVWARRLSHTFQSQAGFVPLCDSRVCLSGKPVSTCFNPRRDLFLFATSLQTCWTAPHQCFNPRRDLFLFATLSFCLRSFSFLWFQSQAGFVPLCDKVSLIGTLSSTKFQSQAGFVPLCDHKSKPDRHAVKHKVSIPGGICSSLRRR